MGTHNAQTSWKECFSKYQDVAIQYFIKGSGPTIVIMPSLARPAEDCLEVGAMIAKQGFRCICPQPRWIGKSTGPEKISMHDLAKDVISVIEQENAAPVFLVGHAYGNWVARVVATDRPDLVKGVCVAAASSRGVTPPNVQSKIHNSHNLSLPDDVRIESMRGVFFATFHDPSVWLDGWSLKAYELQLLAAGYELENFKELQAEWWPAGGKLPFLEIRAELDPTAPPERSHEMKEMFGDRVTTVEIPNAAHALFPEQPEAVAVAIVTYARLLFAK